MNRVLVTGRSAQAAPASVAGFGDQPLARSPFQVSSTGPGQWADTGATALMDAPKLDASVADAYNAPGYWASIRVRGFQLDPRSNFRRDGLPINAETALLLGNLDRLEILKGTSGAQAGVSSPGGLVNLVVKRPRGGANATSASLDLESPGTLADAVDWDRSLSEDGSTALRLNASFAQMGPAIRNSRGQRHQLAAAGQMRPGPADRLELEAELSHQSQPSAPGFSLLGGQLPSARDIDPKLNLNHQAWSQPVVFDGQTASLRWTHELSEQWRTVVQAMGQSLRTDDRAAFPFGCSAENNYQSYCSDGTFDLYDFRSEGERRNTQALAATLEGQAQIAGFAHQFSTGVLRSDFRSRLGPQIYNWAGIGRIDGSLSTPPVPTPEIANTNRTEASTEWHLRDVVSLSAESKLWLGLRHSQLQRDSVGTDGSEPTHFKQSFTTPWLAVSRQISPSTLVYASWGQGVQTEVVPNRAIYTNAGQPLAAQKSAQTELGLKQDSPDLGWSVTAFDIRQPRSADIGNCDGSDGSCTRAMDGQQHHLGLEAALDTRWGAWSLRASAMALHARRKGSATASINGLQPENVAQQALRLQAGYQLASVPGLSWRANVSHEGSRQVLPNNSLALPGWTTLGLGARYQFKEGSRDWTLRAGVDNLANRRAWKESPYQYGHVYLFPLEPRIFRLSAQIAL